MPQPPKSSASALFIQGHPALLMGISWFIGALLGVEVTAAAAIACICYLSTIAIARQVRPLLLAIGIIALAWGYVATTYTLPAVPPEGAPGTVLFRTQSVTSTVLHGKRSFLYRGTALQFTDASGELIGCNLPCSIRIPSRKHRPPADQIYQIAGTLVQGSATTYYLKSSGPASWTAMRQCWTLAELRYSAKQWLSRHLKKHIPDGQVRNFLTGLATGEFGDKLLALEFSRFGLQHLMAISGFHFAIVCAILQLLVRPFLSNKISTLFLILLLTTYSLFLGASASIQRAWIASIVVLAATPLERCHRPLNTLGLALLLVSVADPLQCYRLGFQFSFVVTATILLFSGPTDLLLRSIMPLRRLRIIIRTHPIDQHIYLLIAFLRTGLALTIAVHLSAIPLTLAFFHKFPLMGLLYNLFFPLFTSFTLLLLVVGILVAPVSSALAGLIHSINGSYTQRLLNTIFDMPVTLDFCVRARIIEPWLLSLYLSMLLAWGLYLQVKPVKRQGIRN